MESAESVSKESEAIDKVKSHRVSTALNKRDPKRHDAVKEYTWTSV